MGQKNGIVFVQMNTNEIEVNIFFKWNTNALKSHSIYFRIVITYPAYPSRHRAGSGCEPSGARTGSAHEPTPPGRADGCRVMRSQTWQCKLYIYIHVHVCNGK